MQYYEKYLKNSANELGKFSFREKAIDREGRVQRQMQYYEKWLKNSATGVEKFSFPRGRLFKCSHYSHYSHYSHRSRYFHKNISCAILWNDSVLGVRGPVLAKKTAKKVRKNLAVDEKGRTFALAFRE